MRNTRIIANIIITLGFIAWIVLAYFGYTDKASNVAAAFTFVSSYISNNITDDNRSNTNNRSGSYNQSNNEADNNNYIHQILWWIAPVIFLCVTIVLLVHQLPSRRSKYDVCSPDGGYFFTYEKHTYCFYDVNTIDANNYGNVKDSEEGAYKNVQRFCEDQGGHLAIINTVEENQKLFDETQKRYDKTVFFGLSDADREDKWIWVDGTEDTLKLWSVKSGYQQPDDGRGYGSENYAEFDYDRDNPGRSDNTGKWNDAAYIKDTKVFICEWDYTLKDL